MLSETVFSGSTYRPIVDGFQALAQKWEEYEKKDLNPGLHRCQCGIFSQINILSKAIETGIILSIADFELFWKKVPD